MRVEIITESISQKIESIKKQRLLIAIDGRCAAGKTTLAAHLRMVHNCNVVPMDDFFLQPEQRTPERLAEPGGNVDYERFVNEVLIPLTQGRPFSYRPYDCQKQDFMEAIQIEPHYLNIIEGSYSCHPCFFDYYDLRIFLTINTTMQQSRISKRNGEVCAAQFTEKWIPLEERYFSAYSIEERCDLCFS